MVLYFSGYGLFNSSSHFKKTLRVNYVKRVGNDSSACRLPHLDPFHPSILKFVKDLGKLQCEGDRYSSFINNLLEVKGEDIYSAKYRTIERPEGDDFKVVLSDPTSLSNGAEAGNDENSANTGENFLYTFSYVLYFKACFHVNATITTSAVLLSTRQPLHVIYDFCFRFDGYNRCDRRDRTSI